MYRVVLYLSWVAFFVASSTVEAETLTVSFSGAVTTVPTELSSTFFVSDPITGSFEIDSLSPDFREDPTIGLYIGPTNFSFEFGSYLATGPGGGGGDSVTVLNTTPDTFGFNGTCGGAACIAADVGAYFLTNMSLSLTDSTDTAFSSDALPTSLDINDFDSAKVSLIFQHATLPSKTVVGEISSVTLVPEPSTSLLGMTAMLFVAGLRRLRA
jgi:hypothetical protein